MTPAERMVRAKGWRWLPGMRLVRPGPWSEPDSLRVPECLPNGGYDGQGWLPDLTDPATLGAIEHGLLGPAGWWVSRFHDSGGIVYSAHGPNSRLEPWRDTLAEALADAVEAL